MSDTITYSNKYLKEVADTIQAQITNGVLMSLGARNLRFGAVAPTADAAPLPSLTFDATILPMMKSGGRATAPRTMQVAVFLNGMDYYDVRVTYKQRGDSLGLKDPVVHFEAADEDFTTLARTLLSLDYDGPTVTNPRYA